LNYPERPPEASCYLPQWIDLKLVVAGLIGLLPESAPAQTELRMPAQARAPAPAAEPAPNDDCWARLYEDPGFGGRELTLWGPAEMPDARGPSNRDWKGIGSIQTGPHAIVRIYDREDFRNRALEIGPDQHVAELYTHLGYFEDVESLRVLCSPVTDDTNSR
jgi:hypothetical protein